MAKKYLDSEGLLYLWQKIKGAFVADVEFNSTTGYITKTKNGSTSNIVALPEGASASSTTPAMDGTASAGSENAFARGDHVHPTDTSRASTAVATTSANGLMSSTDKSKLDGIASGATVDDHKWGDVTLDKTSNLALTNDSRIPCLSGSTSVTAGLATATSSPSGSKGNFLAQYNLNGRLSSVTPTAGDNSTLVATTAFVANAINGKIDSSAVGSASGVCPLDANSKVDEQYLPSYVDDVIEAYPRSGQTELSQNWLATGSASGTVITPESGKIYILMADSTNYDTNMQFRWGGSAYVKMADGGVSSITNAEIDEIAV